MRVGRNFYKSFQSYVMGLFIVKNVQNGLPIFGQIFRLHLPGRPLFFDNYNRLFFNHLFFNHLFFNHLFYLKWLIFSS